MIRIAIQSKGRLNEESMALLAEADVKLSVSKRSLLSDSTTFPLQALYMRDDDIPETVANGVADIGIVIGIILLLISVGKDEFKHDNKRSRQ